MASFRIHEDVEGENAVPALSARLNQLGPIQTRRAALGELDVNLVPSRQEVLKPPVDGPDNRLVAKDGSAKENAAKENAAKVGGKKADGKIPVAAKPTCQPAGQVPRGGLSVRSDENRAPVPVAAQAKVDDADQQKRSPLKSSTAVENDVSLSPMSVDDSPAISSTIPLPQSIKQDLEDLYSCVVYKDRILKYLKEREKIFKPKPYYMKRQPDITYNMRTILVDWLVEVGEEYKLSHQTLFLAVSYVDRFLSSMAVVRGKLQLLGASAMFIAAKFEEIYPPEVGEFTYITDDSYTKKQVLRMESLIAKVLGYNLSTPTSYTFLMHFAASTKMSQKVMFLSIFICELTLLEADPYLECSPSLIASGAIALARHALGYSDVWPAQLAQLSGYSLRQLAQVVNHLNETHARSITSAQAATKEKYKSQHFLQVSKVPVKKLSIRVDNLTV
ncbi:cyclin a [Nesidiocoris tenuis]|uniref:Cyclin a n=1 Tax=Nesidiocoris tenuis TaxID=355587 RepID=A0ABN7AXJ0_9HEMI|nr:cyclin a [Nesidiocoris tenuis]